MTTLNVLITSAGRRVTLVELFRAALDRLGVAGSVVAADAKANAPAGLVADRREPVPRVDDPAYVPRLLEICRAHAIGLVVPTIDPELPVLADHAAEFEAAGALPLVSSPEANRICLHKGRTARFFREAGIPAPAEFDPAAVLADPAAAYPFIIKPASGSASVGVARVHDRRELEYHLGAVADPILQEFVAGEEYTLDILVDLAGRVRCVVPRLRIETRAGEISKGVTVRDPALIAAGRRVAEALPGARGCVTAQCIRDAEGRIKFLEINPRFGGGFPLSARAGADFPGWVAAMALGREPEIDPDGWRDGLAMLRYDEALYVDRALIA